MGSDIIVVIVVATALVFDFTNGFHDTANVVATSISTRAMPPRVAVGYASILNFVGAFISLQVAATVAKDVVSVRTRSRLTGRLRRARRRDRLEPDHLVLRPAVELVARADRRDRRRGVRGRGAQRRLLRGRAPRQGDDPGAGRARPRVRRRRARDPVRSTGSPGGCGRGP